MIRKKEYLEKNVWEKALERIEYLYNSFDKVVVSFSGGKDSTAVLNATLEVAKKLNIQHRNIKLDKNFPMIKCNINKRGKKLFFLPFDKFYDQVHVEKDKGEFYTNNIEECLNKGFKHVGEK